MLLLDEYKSNIVPNANFLFPAETIHPFHPDYKSYWSRERLRCTEGLWSQGRFMPPKLYFYVNHGSIKIKLSDYAKSEILGFPFLRDVEWDFHYTLMEARGFSGFSEDPLFTSHISMVVDLFDKPDEVFKKDDLGNKIVDEDGNYECKEYIPARENLRRIHEFDKGKPLYNNPAKNLLFMAGRGLGKDLEETEIVYRRTDAECFDYEEVAIKDIEIGDYILDNNFRFAKVIDKINFTDQDMFRVTFKDGRTIKCGAGHQWTVYGRGNKKQTLSTEEIYKDITMYPGTFNYRIPLVNNTQEDCLSIFKAWTSTVFNSIPYFVDKGGNCRIRYTKDKNVISLIDTYTTILKQIGVKYRVKDRNVYFSMKAVAYKLGLIDTNKFTHTNLAIKSIEPIPTSPSVCIEVDNPEKLFLTTGFIVTHNSYLMSHVVLHEWLFDGVTDMTDLTNNKRRTSIVVGASQTTFSNDHLEKVRIALENMRGGYKVGNITYPAPFTKKYRGTWKSADRIIAEYRKKIKGSKATVGSRSSIRHVSWNANPYAAQGGRNNIMVYEEIGMAPEALEVHAATKDTMILGGIKFGTMIYIGTGGAMSSGGTLAAYDMFYNPSNYDIVSFDDTYEHKGKVGYFVPTQYTHNSLRDENGYIDMEKATAKVMYDRSTKTNSISYANEVQNNPIVPSEIFLVQTGNIFPSTEIKARLGEVENYTELLEKRVELYFDKQSIYNGVTYKIDTDNSLIAINESPWQNEAKEGCIVIYELPQLIEGRVPNDAYIIGHDPFKDNTDGGASFASIFVIKTNKYFDTIGYNEVVAEYIGRPFYGSDVVNDYLLKLSLFYGNARIYFENNVGNVKDYFEKHRKLELLASKPSTVLTSVANRGQGNLTYGYTIGNREVKLRALGYVRNWLLESHDDGKYNFSRIPSRILLQQMLQFNLEGNFDAVMGFAGCIIGLNEQFNQYENRMKELNNISDTLSFISHNKKLFKNAEFNKLSTSEVIL